MKTGYETQHTYRIKKSFWTLVTVISLVFHSSLSNAQIVLDQSQIVASGGSGIANWASYFAQTFTAGVTGDVTTMEIYGRNLAATSPTLLFEIVEGNDPNGTVVATGNVVFSNVDDWQEATMTSLQPLLKDSTYWLRMSNHAPSTGTFLWRSSSSTSYSGGDAFYLFGAPLSTFALNYDYVFKVFVNEICIVSSDLPVTAPTAVCQGDSALIQLGTSEAGVTYFLSDTLGNKLGEYVPGNSGTIDFNTGAINTPSAFRIRAQRTDSYALNFDGVDDYVEFPFSTVHDFLNEDITVNFWMKIADTSYSQAIISRGDPTDFAVNQGGYDVVFDHQTQEVRAVFNMGVIDTLSLGVPVAIDEWTHISYVWDNTAKILTAYKNGTAIGTRTHPSFPFSSSIATGVKLGLSERAGGVYANFVGELDELSWWEGALSASQILDADTNYYVGDETNLIAYYHANKERGSLNMKDQVFGSSVFLTNMDPFFGWSDSQILMRIGCEVDIDSTILIGVQTNPILTLDSIQEVSCFGAEDGAGFLSVVGGGTYTFDWDSDGTGDFDDLEDEMGLGGGTYSIVVEDNGCLDSISISINEPTLVTSSIVSSDSVSCNAASDGQAEALGAGGTGAYTYLWSNSETTALATGLSAGMNYVQISDLNGCVTQDSVLTLEPAVIASIIENDTLLCHADSNGVLTAIVSGGTAGYTYSWSSSATASSANQLPSGTYYVTITDNNGCLHNDSAEVIQPATLAIATYIDSLSCNGDMNGVLSASTTGGTLGYSYLWSTTDTLETITGLSGGTYTVTVEDANGCQEDATFNVYEPSAIMLSATSADEMLGNDGAIDLTVSGGTIGYTFDWDNDGTGDNDDTEDLSNIAGGNFTVWVIDANGCQDSITVTVNSFASVINNEKVYVAVYPNPTESFVQIDISMDALVQLDIINAQGQIVEKLEFTKGMQIDVRHLPSGVYTLSGNISGQRFIQRFVKQ